MGTAPSKGAPEPALDMAASAASEPSEPLVFRSPKMPVVVIYGDFAVLDNTFTVMYCGDPEADPALMEAIGAKRVPKKFNGMYVSTDQPAKILGKLVDQGYTVVGQSGGSKNLRVVWTLQLRADK